ncbi:hypothetical protein CYMTET_5099 [Cymbomonas tetramitiformis]|uniref:Uncharacterized protein n=1 Tax=Cymbomonas tetramitiformis TaxID=36881 RepID=A0AAE0LJE7_9CHLO|nr:hypothetical protein CYMTET_5099 [Cymbomonas tetramitiformis]
MSFADRYEYWCLKLEWYRIAVEREAKNTGLIRIAVGTTTVILSLIFAAVIVYASLSTPAQPAGHIDLAPPPDACDHEGLTALRQAFPEVYLGTTREESCAALKYTQVGGFSATSDHPLKPIYKRCCEEKQSLQ